MDTKRYDELFMRRVITERERQEKMYGIENQKNSYDRWTTILGEEYGEVCKAVYEIKPDELEEELIHVAAVAFSMFQRLQAVKRGGNIKCTIPADRVHQGRPGTEEPREESSSKKSCTR